MKTLYKLISSETETWLNERVQKHLDDGWTLHGTPFAYGIRVCQAMTRVIQPAPTRGMTRSTGPRTA